MVMRSLWPLFRIISVTAFDPPTYAIGVVVGSIAWLVFVTASSDGRILAPCMLEEGAAGAVEEEENNLSTAN